MVNVDEVIRRARAGIAAGDTWIDADAWMVVIAEVERLRADLEHMRKDAGNDSCADYAARNAELEAENQQLRNRLIELGSVSPLPRVCGAVDRNGIVCVMAPHDAEMSHIGKGVAWRDLRQKD